MNRRSLLALLAGAVTLAGEPAETQAQSLDGQRLAPESIESLTNLLVKPSSKPHESSMEELAARFAWVTMGRQLPDEARRRTILRANSNRSEKVGFLGFGEEVGPTKRNFCMVIIALDDKLRGSNSHGDAPAGS